MSAEVKALLRAMEKEAIKMAEDFHRKAGQNPKGVTEIQDAIASIASKQAALIQIVLGALE